jgi:hypothetical protein
LEIKGSISPPDPRFSHFQQPFKFEDAIGNVYPIPLEYGFEQFKANIEFKLKGTLIHDNIMNGDYELCTATDGNYAISPTNYTTLRPGTSIVMRMTLIDSIVISDWGSGGNPFSSDGVRRPFSWIGISHFPLSPARA